MFQDQMNMADGVKPTKVIPYILPVSSLMFLSTNENRTFSNDEHKAHFNLIFMDKLKLLTFWMDLKNFRKQMIVESSGYYSFGVLKKQAFSILLCFKNLNIYPGLMKNVCITKLTILIHKSTQVSQELFFEKRHC